MVVTLYQLVQVIRKHCVDYHSFLDLLNSFLEEFYRVQLIYFDISII
jgi:hypothetical protein